MKWSNERVCLNIGKVALIVSALSDFLYETFVWLSVGLCDASALGLRVAGSQAVFAGRACSRLPCAGSQMPAGDAEGNAEGEGSKQRTRGRSREGKGSGVEGEGRTREAGERQRAPREANTEECGAIDGAQLVRRWHTNDNNYKPICSEYCLVFRSANAAIR